MTIENCPLSFFNCSLQRTCYQALFVQHPFIVIYFFLRKQDEKHPPKVVDQPIASDIGNTRRPPLLIIDTPAVKKAFDNPGSAATHKSRKLVPFFKKSYCLVLFLSDKIVLCYLCLLIGISIYLFICC